MKDEAHKFVHVKISNASPYCICREGIIKRKQFPSMKAVTCSECGYEVQGSNEDEVMDEMMSHYEEEHPTVAAEMENLTDEERKERLRTNMQEVEEIE
jgi:predicted small metal-binding protein